VAKPGPQTRHELREAALPLAIVGQPYSYQFEAALEDPAPDFAVSSGKLPAGFSLSSAGLLSGVGVEDGTASFKVSASNGKGEETTDLLTLTTTGPPLLSLASPKTVAPTTADLSASLNPRSVSTNTWFEYWPAADPAAIDYTSVQTVPAGAAPVQVGAKIGGLQPATDYRFRAVAFNDVSPKGVFTDALALTTPLPAPTAGETFNLTPVDGTTSVKCADDDTFDKLEKPEQVTLDCQVDTTFGTVALTASKGNSGETQTADFWGGTFSVFQEHGDNKEAVLRLAGKRRCERRAKSAGRAGRIQTLAGKGGGRKLWGSGSGNYKTVGSHGAATVRGTIWLVADRCDGSTLFKVSKGTVVVRDFVKKSSVVLEAGESYVAKVAIGRLP
jgi:hypothetical protein